ncbi:MAG: putative DMT superfamily transporter inner membrane protein [Syntrophus sp. PtaU1.Bin208]|nr:MAG: putative DMT superfamily transporter inner membrane protein [Syntrophus sp. PtaU1.Bin208]
MHIFNSRDEALGMISLLAAVALFSTVEIASKFIGPQVDPLVLAFIRFFLTGIVLLIWSLPVLRQRLEPLGAKDYGIFCLNGLLGIYLGISIFHTAIQTMDKAASCAVVFSINPVFVMILARFINGESWNRRKWIAVLVGAIGVCLFAAESGALSLSSVFGIGQMLLSAFFFALSICISRRTVSRYGAVMLMGFSALFGSLFILPVVWVRFTPDTLARLGDVWLPVLYLALPGTALAYALYYFGFLNIPAQKGSMTFFIKPALASVLAALLLHEEINGYMLAGTALILLGLAFSLAKPKPGNI